MTEGAPQTLLWVNDELAATLQEARLALEEHIEGRGDEQTLARCADRLHEIFGALRMVEVHGASLLAEEMELVARELARPDLPQDVRGEALEALGRAMVQLPVYMERVISGGHDIPLVLLPLLNELRAVRGHRLMSENTLLLLNLPARQRLALAENKPKGSGEDARRVGRTLRPRFQKALLGWIRNQQPDSSLAIMAQVLERLESASELPSVYQIWWVTSGVIEALREGGLEASAAVKRLVGQVDRQIKRLIEDGETGISDDPPVELLNALLFYVARSVTRGPRVAAVRESFDLGELLPDEGELEQAKDSLAGPSVRLMHTVAEAIREDLARVKDALDIYARTGRRDEADLEEQAALLKKIGDTLGVLGLAQLQGAVAAESQRLDDVAAGRVHDDEDTMLGIAASLLAAEDRLEAQLVGLVVEPDSGTPESAPEAGEEIRDVTSAVMRESLVNMARIKEAVGEAAAGDVDAQLMDAVPRLLREVNASLLLLGKPRAVRALERISDAVAQRLGPGTPLPPQMAMDRLADAIVSVEYYLETIQAGRREPEYMLDNADASLDALENLDGGPAADIATRAGETVVLLDDEDDSDAAGGYEQTLLIESPRMPPDGQADDRVADRTLAEAPEDDAPGQAPEEAVTGESAPGEPAEARPDPELLELFIEEARELAGAIRENFPKWLGEGADRDALVTVRRAFHTLKGSGRTVGARRIGDFSWSVENLLNRLLDGTVERSDEVVRFLEACGSCVVPLIEQFEVGREPDIEEAAFIAAADALAERLPEAASRVASLLDVPTEAETYDPTVLIRPDFELPAEEAAHDAAVPAPEPAGPGKEFPVTPGSLEAARVPEEPVEAGTEDGAGDAGKPEMDPVLREIFTREAAEHLEAIRAYIGECTDRAEPYRISESMYRACHTLAGSANMAGVEPAVSVARPLNELIRQLYDDRAGLDGAGLELVVQAVDAVAAMVDTVAGGGRALPAASDLPEALGELREAFALRAELGAEQPGAPEDDALEQAPDLDPEILEIFCEEATEILDEADHVVHAWRANPAGADALRTLQRHLHTLKGGARLAGLAGMGDFCHQMESIFEHMQDGRIAPDAAAVDTVQAALDALHGMRDDAADGRIPAGVPELARSLDALLGKEPLESGAEPAGPEADVGETEWAPDAALAGGPVIEVPAEIGGAPAPAEEPPVEEPPVEEPPVEEPPAEEPPAEEPPAEEPPAEEPPAEEPPVEEPPVEEPPVEEPPVEEPPAEEPPAEQVPVPEAPVRETVPLPPPDLVAQPATPDPAAAGPTPIAASAPEPGPPDALSPAVAVQRAETARVDSELLETLLNAAGEVGIYRARLEQQLSSLEFNLDELSQTVSRLRDQLRKLEMETEAQILHRHQDELEAKGEFDPLEMDRYSTIQQLSRALAETATDVGSIQNLLGEQARTADTLLIQQARVVTELQDGLMRTRMVPFHRYAPRLSRIVRQTAAENGRRAELDLDGGTVELDRSVAERILAPLEHMLRNAVVHGIERPDERAARGKTETGRIRIELKREGADMIIAVGDDGSGLNLDAIRHKAEAHGLIEQGTPLTPTEAARLILAPGFSTATELTQSAGRGVGMDVVETEIRGLGGTLDIDSQPGKGTRFEIRLPFRRAITQALVVRAGDELFALPLPTVEGVVRIRREELDRYLGDDAMPYRYGKDEYPITHLATLVEGQAAVPSDEGLTVPVLLVRAGGRTAGLLTDELLGAREVVVKPLGPQLSGIRGISGATILGDGRIVLIIDAGALIRRRASEDAPLPPPRATGDDSRTFVMVVDDSITVRRVTERLLERNGMRVATAKDGVDAVTLFQEQTPDIVLLDIEMPRMDGYEVAAHMRADPRLQTIPIIMITSRVGQKHRARAIEAGVDAYLGKPYQESELLAAVDALVDTRRRSAGGQGDE